jgi:hypothetical protein
MQADAGGADSMPRSVYGLRCSLKRKRVMDETRAVAHLPSLDIGILHRRRPGKGAEQLLTTRGAGR